MVANPLMHRAITHAQAHMVSAGLNPDALAGVNGFIAVLLNLSEENEPVKMLPSKSLKSFDHSFQIGPKTTTSP